MPGTFKPSQSFEHELNPVKGWPDPYGLDKVKAWGSTQRIRRGRIVSIDPVTNQFVAGCAAGRIPLFAFVGNEQGDYDAVSDVGNITGGTIMALPATGNFELETTEYDDTGVYPPNTPLACENGVTLGPDNFPITGRVRPAVGGLAGAEDIVGFITDNSPIPNANGYGKSMVRFYAYWMPRR